MKNENEKNDAKQDLLIIDAETGLLSHPSTLECVFPNSGMFFPNLFGTSSERITLYNITPKAVLNYGSEKWILKQRGTQTLEAAQMKFLRTLLGLTTLDKIRNTETGEILNVKKKTSSFNHADHSFTIGRVNVV